MVASTLWSIPSCDDDAFSCFDALKMATKVGGKSLAIGDSKKLFKPGVAGSIDALRHATWASLRACRFTGHELRDCLSILATEDAVPIANTPWLAEFNDRWISGNDDPTGAAIDSVWSRADAKLVAVRVRVITAKEFNSACDRDWNKADLLSRTTLGLVASLADIAGSLSQDQSRHIDVFCDRHGGRRFYGGVLQHVFAQSVLAVESESAKLSVYRLQREDEQMRIRFTVKGDSFLPVALSSMIAKFLRETAMKSFNDYFVKQLVSNQTLRPTAGYPVDADRFLADIEPIIAKLKIDRSTLVRNR